MVIHVSRCTIGITIIKRRGALGSFHPLLLLLILVHLEDFHAALSFYTYTATVFPCCVCTSARSGPRWWRWWWWWWPRWWWWWWWSLRWLWWKRGAHGAKLQPKKNKKKTSEMKRKNHRRDGDDAATWNTVAVFSFGRRVISRCTKREAKRCVVYFQLSQVVNRLERR